MTMTTCRGCIKLGTACGKCSKCLEEQAANSHCPDPHGSGMDVPTALSVADKYSKTSSGIGCLHAEAYEVLAKEIRRLKQNVEDERR